MTFFGARASALAIRPSLSANQLQKKNLTASQPLNCRQLVDSKKLRGFPNADCRTPFPTPTVPRVYADISTTLPEISTGLPHVFHGVTPAQVSFSGRELAF